MSSLAKAASTCLWMVLIGLIPGMAHAQATIAGVVRDTSGAVLPGVTVEASSPALIEKVRSVVTDDTGQFQIVNLAAGTYAVTFTLPGFNSVTRTGVELSGAFTAKIDTEMRVGAIEETITVTGETPIVDVQNTRRQRVIDRETIDNIPTSRTAYDMASLIPGVSRGALTNQDVGGSSSSGSPTGNVAIHGGRPTDQVLLRNGIETVGQSANGNTTPVNINPVGTQEVNVDTASAGAEYTTGGVRFNVIPREGGNAFNGALFTSYASPSWQAENLTQQLKDRGVSSATGSRRTAISILDSAARSSRAGFGSSCPPATGRPRTTRRGCTTTEISTTPTSGCSNLTSTGPRRIRRSGRARSCG